MAGSTPGSRVRLQAVAGMAVFALLFVAPIGVALQDLDAGGSGWRQGDWLVNSAAGPVRRALSGDAMIALSDLSGVALLPLVVTIECALALAFIAALATVLWRTGWPDRVLILATSPALAPVFWYTAYKANFRKEVIGYLALVALALAARSRHWKTISLLATGLYAVGCVLHEVNAFLLPFFLAGLAVLHHPRAAWTRFGWLAAAASLSAVGAALYALLYGKVEDAQPMCDVLLERGLGAQICDGAVLFVTDTGTDALSRVGERMYRVFLLPLMLAFLLSMGPLAVALWKLPRRWMWIAATAGTVVLFLPLYALAIDWGRWISLQVTCLTLLILTIHAAQPQAWLSAPLPRYATLALFLLNMAWGMDHISAKLRSGMFPLFWATQTEQTQAHAGL